MLAQKRGVIKSVVDLHKNHLNIKHSRHRAPLNGFTHIFSALAANNGLLICLDYILGLLSHKYNIIIVNITVRSKRIPLIFIPLHRKLRNQKSLALSYMVPSST